MTGDRRSNTGTALRALASPVTVASLVLLALNDHVLKQAWPGWVTGKLSDVVGLVVAPAVLAVALAVTGVRRPHLLAGVLTGIGFAWVKTTVVGAELASDVWSAVGWQSYIRRDPTDLLALPALLVALRVHRQAQAPRPPRQAQATAAVGAVLLPFALLTTAATSCSNEPAPVSVGVFEGLWGPAGGQPPAERRAVFAGRIAVWKPPGESVRLQALTGSESERIVDAGPRLDEVCDPATPNRCWRDAHRDAPTIEETRDGGRTWKLAWAMSKGDLAEIRERYGESCGEPRPVRVSDLAALPTADGVLVLAAVSPERLLLRETSGEWRDYGHPELSEIVEDPPHPDPSNQLRPVESTPTAATSSAATGSPPTGPPSPPCASPSWVTITPNPRNGPPTAQPRCGIASGP